MKKCSTTLTIPIREIKIKATMRYLFTHTRMSERQIVSVVGKLEPLDTVGGNIKCKAAKQSGNSSQKLNVELPHEPAIPLLGIHTEKWTCMSTQTLVHKCSQQQYHNNGELSIRGPHHGLLFGNKRKWSIYTVYNMDEPWKHAKWKDPVIKIRMLDASISTETESRSLECAKEKRGVTANRCSVWRELIKCFKVDDGDGWKILWKY